MQKKTKKKSLSEQRVLCRKNGVDNFSHDLDIFYRVILSNRAKPSCCKLLTTHGIIIFATILS